MSKKIINLQTFVENIKLNLYKYKQNNFLFYRSCL